MVEVKINLDEKLDKRVKVYQAKAGFERKKDAVVEILRFMFDAHDQQEAVKNKTTVCSKCGEKNIPYHFSDCPVCGLELNRK